MKNDDWFKGGSAMKRMGECSLEIEIERLAGVNPTNLQISYSPNL
jgi:hypothetical protein